MKRIDLKPFIMIVAGFLLIIIAVVMVLAQSQGSNQGVSAIRIGQTLNDFTLNDMQGKPIRLNDYRGSVVLLNVWATWCPPCRSEMPSLQAFYDANRSKGFVILAVNGGDAQADVQAFAQQYSLTFPILLDPRVDLINHLGIFDYPTSVLIDRSGVIKNIQIGMYQPAALNKDVLPYLQ